MIYIQRMSKEGKSKFFLVFLVFVVMKVISAENKTTFLNKKLIINLTTKSFDEQVKKIPHFVMFYTPR